MPKPRRNKRTKPSPTLGRRSISDDLRRLPRRRLSKLLLAFGLPSILVGIVLTVPSYLPKIDIEPSSEPFTGDMFPGKFTIWNHGLLSVHTVDARCWITQFGDSRHDNLITNSQESPRRVADSLLPERHADFACITVAAFNPKENVNVANITIIATYRPSFIWRRQFYCQRLQARPNTNRVLTWFSTDITGCSQLWQSVHARELEHHAREKQEAY